MITLTIRFVTEFDAPAGPDCEHHAIAVDFDTDDMDHAFELAQRLIDSPTESILPFRVIPGTVSIA